MANHALHRYSYQKVLDNRKHPIRGLWRRNGGFCARLTVEEADGRKKNQWAPLAANAPMTPGHMSQTIPALMRPSE